MGVRQWVGETYFAATPLASAQTLMKSPFALFDGLFGRKTTDAVGDLAEEAQDYAEGCEVDKRITQENRFEQVSLFVGDDWEIVLKNWNPAIPVDTLDLPDVIHILQTHQENGHVFRPAYEDYGLRGGASWDG